MIDKRMLVLILLFIFLLVACGKNTGKTGTMHENVATISISGSTSVGPLVEKVADKYVERKPVNIEINQIGSSAGIMNALNGVSEIGMSSRDLVKEEKKQLKETVIAYDGIVVVTHPNNHVENLTLEQVKQIFTGKITNWKEVGGKDMEIVAVSREEGSGSRDAFQEIVGYSSGELVKNAIIASGNGNIKTTVANNQHAIGFISFEYMDQMIYPVRINGVEPTVENVLQQKYPLARPLLFVYKEENMTNNGRKLIDFILSPEGQKIVKNSGMIPVK